MAKHYVYEFYAELVDFEPKIWRRFVINGEKRVSDLAYVVMIMFEMQASHLFKIRRELKSTILENISYELVDINIENFLTKGERLVKANETTIRKEFSGKNLELFFEYDFGDGWEIKLTLESYEKVEVKLVTLPKVLEGQGFGIIEDCGGTDILKQIYTVLNNASHKERTKILKVLDNENLNMNKFNIEEMNVRIKKLLNVYMYIYEYRLEPTQEILNLITRK